MMKEEFDIRQEQIRENFEKDNIIRPKSFSEFRGQPNVTEKP
jgi:Holliday junction resolvasome RuvABC ATP-dependent DNA helicase subunit